MAVNYSGKKFYNIVPRCQYHKNIRHMAYGTIAAYFDSGDDDRSINDDNTFDEIAHIL
jgi:hypothetical protein